jgi:hypothetical protein
MKVAGFFTASFDEGKHHEDCRGAAINTPDSKNAEQVWPERWRLYNPNSLAVRYAEQDSAIPIGFGYVSYAVM